MNTHTSERPALQGREIQAEYCARIEQQRDTLKADNARLREALKAAVERMEAVADGIPVNNRNEGVSQRAHVAHMAGHLAQHAKIAREALEKICRACNSWVGQSTIFAIADKALAETTESNRDQARAALSGKDAK